MLNGCMIDYIIISINVPILVSNQFIFPTLVKKTVIGYLQSTVINN